jgi:hypothetical protein
MFGSSDQRTRSSPLQPPELTHEKNRAPGEVTHWTSEYFAAPPANVKLQRELHSTTLDLNGEKRIAKLAYGAIGHGPGHIYGVQTTRFCDPFSPTILALAEVAIEQAEIVVERRGRAALVSIVPIQST